MTVYPNHILLNGRNSLIDSYIIFQDDEEVGASESDVVLALLPLNDRLNLRMEVDRKAAADLGLVTRHSFKHGIIGTDYVPPVTNVYDVGKTYVIGGVEIKEKKYQEYLTDGDYNKDVYGYTAIYQLINSSDNYYIIPAKISCTGLFSDIQKRSFVNKLINWSYDNYQTKLETSNIAKSGNYILGPKESIKDQVIVGEKIPEDFIIDLGDIIKVNRNWVENLIVAISGNNLDIINAMLSDSKASSWHDNIQENKEKVIKNNQKKLTDKLASLVKLEIKVKGKNLGIQPSSI